MHRKATPYSTATTETGTVPGASYARFSSDLQRDTSIDDQQRVCRERAERDGVIIDPRHEFVDRAVSGTVASRDGLDNLRESAARGEFKVLYVYSLSRLSRESTFVYSLMKELVESRKIRLVSISEGVDSSQVGWYEMGVLLGLQNERYLKDLSLQVKRGQEGTVLSGYSAGDTRFGYLSVPDPAGATVGRGRNAKPRMVYAIDEPAAKWVVQIFRWFADEKRSIAWIVRELNRLHVPKDARSTKATWARGNVVGILSSEKYIGRWPWRSKCRERDWQTGRVRQVRVPEAARERFLRELPELRIVDDALFDLAQVRLKASRETFRRHRNAEGRLQGSPSRCSKKYLLDGLLLCRLCGRRFVIVDHAKRYYGCSGHHRNQCSCVTRLPRELAEKSVYDAVALKLLQDAAWRAEVYKLTVEEWRSLMRSRPDEVAGLRKKKSELEHAVTKLVDSIETSSSPPDILVKRLSEREEELRHVQSQLRALEATSPLPAQEPTAAWINEQLDNLLKVLSDPTPAAIEGFQGLIDGAVILDEIPIPNRKRKSLRAELHLLPHRAAHALIGSANVDRVDKGDGETIVLDFRKITVTEDQARRAHSLWSDGRSCSEIARELQVSDSRITEIFKFAEQTLGLPYPKTRRRRVKGPLATRIESDVIARWESGMLIRQIADDLGVCRPTVRSVLVRWYESRGESIPDGRTRRRNLAVKQRPRRNKEVAPDSVTDFLAGAAPPESEPSSVTTRAS